MKLGEYIDRYGNLEIEHTKLNEILGIKEDGIKPNIGDEYWFLGETGIIFSNIWKEDIVDDYRHYTDNCFLTEEAAELKKRVIETEIELKKYAEEYNKDAINWKNGKQTKWYLQYDCFIDDIYVHVSLTMYMPNQIYFTSTQIAEDAVDKIGKERIKEYLKYGSEKAMSEGVELNETE